MSRKVIVVEDEPNDLVTGLFFFGVLTVWVIAVGNSIYKALK